jgi:hypothetical protein
MKRMLALALTMLLLLNVAVPAYGQSSLVPTPAGYSWPTGGSDLGGEAALNYRVTCVDAARRATTMAPRGEARPPASRPVRADSLGEKLRTFWDYLEQSIRAFWETLTQETARLVQRLERELLEPLRRILGQAVRSL